MRHAVLIVDDDEQVRKLCGITLENSDYIVREVRNGKEALAAIRGTAFDLVVLDLSMPDIDGFEFLKIARAELPKLKILVISGFLSGTLLTAAKLFGASATLAKPFQPDSLRSLVEEVLSEKGPRLIRLIP